MKGLLWRWVEGRWFRDTR